MFSRDLKSQQLTKFLRCVKARWPAIQREVPDLIVNISCANRVRRKSSRESMMRLNAQCLVGHFLPRENVLLHHADFSRGKQEITIFVASVLCVFTLPLPSPRMYHSFLTYTTRKNWVGEGSALTEHFLCLLLR